MHAGPVWWSASWGECFARSTTCEVLGVKDNLCGTCVSIPGGFQLYNSRGLRFNGFTFDDNNKGQGSIQARNVCSLAKYGNQGQFGSDGVPNEKSFGFGSGNSGPHFYGTVLVFCARACWDDA
jgi:hypothetical protein